jgi:midasin
MLENCNLCNPSILDRLNSLLEEDNRELALNESGLVDGEMRIVKAHPNFRIFFVINESTLDYANISAPLRNRCVEIQLGEDVDEYKSTVVQILN